MAADEQSPHVPERVTTTFLRELNRCYRQHVSPLTPQSWRLILGLPCSPRWSAFLEFMFRIC